MPHFFASNLHAVALPARTKNFEFIFEAKSVCDESAIIFVKSLAKSLCEGQKILLSKQKKGERFLVKFNKHFSTHSKEIIKSALKEYADLAGAEIVSHNLNENKIKVDSAYLLDWHGICALLGGNSVLGMQFRTCENFRASTDSSLVESPKISTNTKATPQSLPLRFCETQNLDENSVKSAESTLDSVDSQNLHCNPPFCPSERSEESQKNNNRDSSVASLPQNDNMKKAQNDKVKKSKNNKVGTRIAESTLDSANPAPSTQEANLGLREVNDADRTLSHLRKQAEAIHKKSPQDEFAFLEIGFGSGRHILHLAQKHPTAQIIGLEIYRPAISQVLRQIEILGLKNLYLASLDARVLCEVLPAKCLDRIYLHFPVPWLKNPQRRVLSAQFLSNAMRALKDDGFFELLTDSAEYFAFAKSLARDYKFVAEEGAEGEVVSKYEARWRRQKKVIYKLCIYPACGNSPLGLHSADLVNFGHCADFSLALRPKFTKNHESQTENPSVVDSALGAESSKNNSSLLDSANSQNLGAKCAKIAESSDKIQSKKPFKSFCYFWLLPKVESPLPLNPNLPNNAESQNLNQNNPRVSANLESRPLRGAKNREQGCSSATADFLLEADKRGSPPKSEKATAFWEHNKKELGGAGRGVQPFLREKTRELNKQKSDDFAESRLDSAELQKLQNGLPRRFCESARNDDSFLDSANPTPFSPTKICKKEYFLHIKNKYIFEGGVVLFASFGAYYAPSSAYFVICGNNISTISEIIPTRANIDALGLFMELCFDN